jgi:predicted molibdopterin-dependent oxidoreductase YjgC
LDQPLPWRNPQEIFQGLAQAVPYFGGLSYEKIGSQGTLLPLPASTITSAQHRQSASSDGGAEPAAGMAAS